jgi:hypothetical protein
MAEIIPLEDFIGFIRETTSFVTDEDSKKPLDNDEFAKKLIGALGAVKAERGGMFGDAGFLQWGEGVRLNDLKKFTELIPEELRTDWAIESVNWDLFLKSVEASGVKVNDNVKNNIGPAYIKINKALVLADAEALVDKAKGSTQQLNATAAAYEEVWLEQPFSPNVKSIVGVSNLDNTNTVFGQYLAEVDRIVQQKEADKLTTPESTVAPLTPEPSTTPSSTIAPSSTTAPDKPTLGYESSAGMNSGGGVITNDPLKGAVNATEQAALTPQEYLFQNPEAGYLEVMNLTQGNTALKTGAKFGQKYGYNPSESGQEWTLRSFYDLPLKLNTVQLGKLQDDLRKAGFFAFEGGRLPMKGTLDDPTTAAWTYFLSSAVLAGEEPAVHLVKRIQGVAQVQWDSEVLGRDSLTIKSRANDLGSAVLGRGLLPEEITELENVVRGWEKEEVRQGNYADQPMQVDLNARIEQYLIENNAEQAMWTNFANSEAATSKYWG